MIEVKSPATVRHPLEPLNANEIKIVADSLRSQKSLGKSIRFISVALKEPPKELIYNYLSSDAIPREAFAVLFNNDKNECYEAVVSIETGVVTSWVHIPGVQPTMSADEQVECEQAVLASPAFKAALEQYGITDMSLVMVDIWSAGYYGNEEEKNLRLARPLCFVRTEPDDNGYARP
ncbi:MAG: maoII 1, partial [Chitinophagaceae bacterium]|nr:maoII 1 [Chitinophagaceae bacterium]